MHESIGISGANIEHLEALLNWVGGLQWPWVVMGSWRPAGVDGKPGRKVGRKEGCETDTSGTASSS